MDHKHISLFDAVLLAIAFVFGYVMRAAGETKEPKR